MSALQLGSEWHCIFGGSVLTKLEVSGMSCVLSSQQALQAGRECDIVLLNPSDTWLGCHNPEQQHQSVTSSLRLAGTFADRALEPLTKAGAGAACPNCSWGDSVIVLILQMGRVSPGQ